MTGEDQDKRLATTSEARICLLGEAIAGRTYPYRATLSRQLLSKEYLHV